MMLLAVVIVFAPSREVLNVFKITIAPGLERVKGKVEHVQVVVIA